MIIKGFTPMEKNNPFNAGKTRKRRRATLELSIEQLFKQLSNKDIFDLIILKNGLKI